MSNINEAKLNLNDLSYSDFRKVMNSRTRFECFMCPKFILGPDKIETSLITRTIIYEKVRLPFRTQAAIGAIHPAKMLTMMLKVNPDAGVLAKKLTMQENGIVLIPYKIIIKTRVPPAPESNGFSI